MALAVRFVPNSGGAIIRTPSGRTYPITGPTVDVPFPDAETIQPDQATKLMVIGATADRLANDPNRINWPPPAMFDNARSADLSSAGLEPGAIGEHYRRGGLTIADVATARLLSVFGHRRLLICLASALASYARPTWGRVRLSCDVNEIRPVFSIPPHPPTPNFVAPTAACPLPDLAPTRSQGRQGWIAALSPNSW